MYTAKRKLKDSPSSSTKLFGCSFFSARWCLFCFILHYLVLKLIPEPLMYILKSQSVSFVERLDLFFIYIWMTWSIITIALFSFSTMYVHQLHAKGNKKRNTIIFHLLLIILPLFIATKEGVEMIQKISCLFSFIFPIVVPTMVILLNRRKRKCREIILILLVCSLLLSGCWDENLLKDLTIVSLMGIEGQHGEVKAEFAFPSFEDQSISYLKSSGKGVSLREARSDANHRTMEELDIASVEVILVAEDTAKIRCIFLFRYVIQKPKEPT